MKSFLALMFSGGAAISFIILGIIGVLIKLAMFFGVIYFIFWCISHFNLF